MFRMHMLASRTREGPREAIRVKVEVVEKFNLGDTNYGEEAENLNDVGGGLKHTCPPNYENQKRKKAKGW